MTQISDIQHNKRADGQSTKPWLLTQKSVAICRFSFFMGAERGKKKQRFQPNKMVKDLEHREQGKCEGGWRQGGKKWVHTYIFPIASHPTVMCAFCRLTRPDDGRTLVSITKILSDTSGALQSAVNISVLNADSTGYRALAKETQNT